VVVRADAAFAKRKIYEALEERNVKYAIRIPPNENLQQDIAEPLTRPVGRPSYKPVVRHRGFIYQAESWRTARRVVAERHRLEPGKSVAAARAAQEDRRLVVDQIAAEAGKDGRPIDPARPLLLAAFGGESSYATLAWSPAGQDRSAALASGVGGPPVRPDFKRRAGWGQKGVGGIDRERGRFVLGHSQKW